MKTMGTYHYVIKTDKPRTAVEKIIKRSPALKGLNLQEIRSVKVAPVKDRHYYYFCALLKINGRFYDYGGTLFNSMWPASEEGVSASSNGFLSQVGVRTTPANAYRESLSEWLKAVADDGYVELTDETTVASLSSLSSLS